MKAEIKKIIKKYKIFFCISYLIFIFNIFLFGYINEKSIDYYIWVIIFFGLLNSIFYGWKAVVIFSYPDKKLPEYGNSWYIHQFWFNFTGSIVGWCLIVLSVYILKIVSLEKLTISHIIIFGLGALGIVGLLPSLLAQIPNIFYLLTKEKAEDLYKKYKN